MRLSRKHPWGAVSAWDLDFIDVHGGITYAEKGPPWAVPDFSYQWWIGFDCAHYTDKPDPALCFSEESYYMLRAFNRIGMDHALVRTQGFVEDECRRLCELADEADAW